MQVKKTILVVLLPVLALTSYFIYQNSYTELTPLAFDNERGFIKIDIYLASFNQNLETVFQYHHESYLRKDRKILIKRKLANDEELVWNYTTKALDSAWLRQHRP